mgnify:CR=1 FL=1
MKINEMTNEELAECIESARLAPAKYVRKDDLNFHSEAIHEAAARLRNLGEISEAVGREATREKSSQVGNAAKLREACEALMSEIGGYLTDGLEVIWCSISGKTIKKARAALSSPPRNCDLFATSKEAGEAFISQACENPCGNCTVSDECHNPLVHECGIKWLFAEAKGVTDGSK